MNAETLNFWTLCTYRAYRFLLYCSLHCTKHACFRASSPSNIMIVYLDWSSLFSHNTWWGVNSYSASRNNWCTATLWNRIMTAQCEGMGEVGSARYEPALLPPCPSIRVLSYSNCQEIHSHQQTGLAVQVLIEFIYLELRHSINRKKVKVSVLSPDILDDSCSSDFTFPLAKWVWMKSATIGPALEPLLESYPLPGWYLRCPVLFL